MRASPNHLKLLREFKKRGYFIDELIERQRKGGPEFFSSQIIVQEQLSGSGTYDLRIFHGLSKPKYYRNVTAWDCQAADFPIVYFVGFRVRKIENGTPPPPPLPTTERDIEETHRLRKEREQREAAEKTIFVSREKDIVNVISLSALDPGLDKHIKVQLFESTKVLCPDIATGCDKRIFYSRED